MSDSVIFVAEMAMPDGGQGSGACVVSDPVSGSVSFEVLYSAPFDMLYLVLLEVFDFAMPESFYSQCVQGV